MVFETTNGPFEVKATNGKLFSTHKGQFKEIASLSYLRNSHVDIKFMDSTELLLKLKVSRKL